MTGVSKPWPYVWIGRCHECFNMRWDMSTQTNAFHIVDQHMRMWHSPPGNHRRGTVRKWAGEQAKNEAPT